MPRSLAPALLTLALAGLAPIVVAEAASAVPMPFRGSLAIVFGPFPIIAEFEGAGVATLNGDGSGGPLTSLGIPAGAFSVQSLDFVGTSLIHEIRVTALNGPGQFSGLTPNAGGGMMPLSGAVNLCVLATCDTAAFVLGLPLSPVGFGGSARVTGPVTVTLFGVPWTKGTTTISTTFAVTVLNGFGHGPLSNTLSTAQPGGVLELVTPVRVATSLPGLDELTGYAVLQVRFVPEPGTLPLVAVGLLLLAHGVRVHRKP